MSVDIKDNLLAIKNRYRPEIDGLRAFAVLTVIINHFNKEILPNGYLGVDIFFVISGFVITSSLYQRPSKNFKDFISGFYERRVKRLVPALSVFVLIMSIAICLFNPIPGVTLKTGLASLFGLSNLYLFHQMTDYFANSTELNVFTHTWSLGIEEQFYIFFPLLVWFTGFGRQTKNGARNLLLTVGVLSVISLIIFLYLYPNNQSAAYFLMPARFWEMAVGCLLFIGVYKKPFIKRNLEKAPPLLVLTLIVGVMYLPMSLAAESTIAVVFLSVVLIASIKKETKAFKIFTNSKVVYIGLISYSLYLWHWGVLAISRWTIGIHWWSVPFQIMLMFGLAIASHYYIETPLRKGNWFGRRWRTLVAGGGAILLLSGGLITLGKPLRGQLYTGKELKISMLPVYFPFGESCLDNLSKHTICYLIDNKSDQKLWLIGDSHANSLYGAGAEVANSLGMNLQFISAAGTPFPPVGHYRKRNKKGDLEALDEFKFVEKKLYKEINNGDIVLITMRSPYHFGGTYYEYPESAFIFMRKDGSLGTQETYFIDWSSAVKNLASFAQKKGAKVIVQTPIPEWEKEFINPKCSTSNKQWFNSLVKTNCQIESKFFIEEDRGIFSPLIEKLNQLANSHENIFLFDTYKFVCPESNCRFTMEGVDIYRDDDHLSYEWAKDILTPEIYKFIKSISDQQ